MSPNNAVAARVSRFVEPPLPAAPAASAETPARFRVETLGCKVNRFESELLAQDLAARGYRRARDEAEVCIINTCTVTAEADRQARQLVRRLVRENPHAFVAVTGCYAQMNPAACAAIAGVDWVLGNAEKLQLPKLLARRMRDEAAAKISVRDLHDDIGLPRQLLGGFDGRVRAFVQAQQGCDQGCTFCIIHKARGPNRSFAPETVRRQVAKLVHGGYREIVLCGVDLGGYGADLPNAANENPGDGLAELLTQLLDLPGDFRLRLSSLDPAHLSDALIERLATQPRICPQLHLSLQSGNTLILKRMKRRASREMVYDRVQKLRRAIPRLVLSADIMTGFPTENEAQFADTLAAVHDLQIAYPHVFPYSPREGTPAARIPKQVAVQIRKARAAAVRAAGREVWLGVAATRVGESARVLVEGAAKGFERRLQGRAADYFAVRFAAEAAAGEWADVRVESVADDALLASVLN